MRQSRIENILLCLDTGEIDTGWIAFLNNYATTIHDTVRKFEANDSAADDCYEYVCARLSDDDFRRLRSFNPSGPARFKTWLTTVTANLCIDWRRSMYGRKRVPRAVRNLPDLEQLVFRYLFRQGMTHHECLHVLQGRYPEIEASDIHRINADLYVALSAAQRWQVGINRNDVIPADDLDLLCEASDSQPEMTMQREREREQLESALSRLEPEQRLLLRLRYQQDLTLKEVARLAGYEDPFKARRAIDKALLALEKIFNL